MTKDGHGGKGIGKTIVKMLRDHGEEKGCYKVILDCKEELLPFYGKNGFERKEVQAAWYK